MGRLNSSISNGFTPCVERRRRGERRVNNVPVAVDRRRRGGARRVLESATRVEISELESRLLYCAGMNHEDSQPLPRSAMGPNISSGVILAGSPLSSLPSLSSDPGAAATLYLDFTGEAAQNWGGYNVTTTPAYDQDGDATTFSAGELANIQVIWARVSEAYSPWNINVTTVDPGNLNDGQTVKVVVGGSGTWLGASAGGVSFVGSFTNSAPNVAWVFPAMLGNGDPKYTGDAITHESGHAFGLVHQSAYSGTTKTAEYRGGTSLVAPFMGSSYYSTRGKWSNGQSSTGYNVYQDDMAVIGSVSNGFGFRTDDHGDTIGTADALDVNGATVTGSGILSTTTDVDAFSFVTQAGTVNFAVNVAQYGAMLDATLKLVDLSGNIIAQADTANLGESLSANVAAGSYRIIVSSKGVYGDVGQYTVSGTIVPSANYVATPSNLTAAVGAGGVTLAWYDNSWNETGYTVQRSDDGGGTWNTIDTLAANSRGYTDATTVVAHTYQYRVFAFNDTDQSANSNAVNIAVTPATPGGLTATSVSSSRIDLTWGDVSGESGYVIERSVNGTTWSTVTTTTSDVTSYSDTGLVAGTKYFYRIRANSSVGASANATAVNATTRTTQPALSVTVVSSAQINLSWTNVLGETGYRLERSTDNSTWSTLGIAGVNVVTYANTGLNAGTVYYYRVVAVDAGGDSAAGTANGTTLVGMPSGVTATAVSTTEIDVSWANQVAETGYRVERSLDERNWILVTTTAADVTSYANTGLVGGTRYIYRIRAVNAGGYSTPSANVSTYTVPLAPTASVTVASDTQVNVFWSNVAGETNYVVQRSADGSTGWATIASPLANVVAYGNLGLTADTDYFYRVIAHNASGDSAASNVVAAHTMLPAPTGLTATAPSTTEIDLTWNDSTNETTYRLERSLDERTWTLVATLGADVTSYANTGLVGGTRYLYRVRAVNAGGASAPSTNASTYTVPLAPTISGTVASDTQVNVAWSNVNGETNYVLQRSDDGVNGWTTIGSPLANVIGFANTGLTADTSYSYRVIAHNASGDSAASAVFTAHTLIHQVSNFHAVGVSTSQIDLSWDDSTGETGYRIERYAGTAWALLTTVGADVHTYSNTGLAAGTAYYYRVRALNAGGMSLVDANIPAGVTLPVATSVGAVALSMSQVRLSWLNVAGETGYRIERSADGSTGWSTAGAVGANVISYTDTGLTADTPEFYRVTAFNQSGDAAASTVQGTRTLLPAPVGLTATATSTTQINLAWTDSTGETGYTVERSLNGTTWGAIATLAADTTSYSNTGLVAGTTYYYRVRATNAGGSSEPGVRASATTIPPAAALTATAASATQINLSWSNVLGETGYRLETSTDGSTWSTLTTTAANVVSYAHTGLTANTLHYYRVTPFNAAGDAASTTISKTTPVVTPTGFRATATSATTAAITWNDTTGETSYRLEKWNGRAWALLTNLAADATSYNDAGLLANHYYYYQLFAVNAGGNSVVTPAATIVTPAASKPVKGKVVAAPVKSSKASAFQVKKVIGDLAA